MSEGKLIPLAGEGQTIVIKDALRELQAIMHDLPSYIEYTKVSAQMAKVRFDEYVTAGFTESQALELCKSIG